MSNTYNDATVTYSSASATYDNQLLGPWRPGPVTEGEYAAGSRAGLVDAAGVSLADSSAVTLTDDGSSFSPLPATGWSINDSA